jgi:dTDP-4-dehydrorhamnose 3,5-epimerase
VTRKMVPTLPGLKLVTPPIFRDSRGFFSETYNARSISALGIDAIFVQDNHSLSVSPGVVRGLHFQIPPKAQDKLIRVIRGSILDVVVDIRVGSPTYGHHDVIELSAANWSQLWVPKGFAHGFCTLEPHTEVIYKVTDDYSPEHDRGLKWNDPQLAIPWPVSSTDAIVSDKDKTHPALAQFVSPFKF